MATSTTITADAMTLAARHGLQLTGDITFNEMGLDFRVGFATDTSGRRWVLRIPRRDDMLSTIEREARILDFVKPRLPVAVPDWQVCTDELVAYPMLLDPMALVFDAETYAVTWNIDREAELYVESLADVLVALHQAPVADAVASGVPDSSSEQDRLRMRRDLDRVKREIGIGRDLEERCLRWLDNDRLWPDFSVLTHGDLYAGHVTAAPDGRVSGVIDWTEARIGDPSVDFAGHLAAFSPKSLERLVAAYQRAGARTWPAMIEHIEERHAASPLHYGAFALDTGNEEHIAAARAQLGVSDE